MKKIMTFAAVAVCALATLVSGCKEETQQEKAEKAVNQAAADAGKTADAAMKKAGEAADAAAKKAGEAADATKKAVGDAAKKLGL